PRCEPLETLRPGIAHKPAARSAPPLDWMHGRERGFPRSRPLSFLRLEAELATAPHDMPRRRPREMGPDDRYRLVAVALDERLARLRAHLRIGIELANPVRMRDLNRMMN